jgi:hypothetical protein
MQPLRFFVLVPALAASIIFSSCGKRQEPATAAPAAAKPATVPEPAAKSVADGPQAKRGKAPPRTEDLAAARVEGGYVTVLFKNGRRGLLPVTDFAEIELEELEAFAAEHPLARGKSSMVIAKVEQKKTIEKQATEEGTETVLLVSPAKLRDQIGGTCMFYARVHYLDIAGYPVSDAEIYRVINNVSTDQPYLDYRYHVGMQMLFLRQKPIPVVHFPDPTLSPFEWARQQLRKGRPVLAALPENVWLSLPADFLATHPFDGSGKIGHQVVINGFTYNETTKKATFHVVNSWRDLAEFDVPVEIRDEQQKNILIEQSLSPKGEPPEEAVKVVAGAVTLLKPVGKQNLYSVETNLGPKKVMAVSEEGAKEFVELAASTPDSESAFGEYISTIYDYIYSFADPKIRDVAAATLLAEVLKISPAVPLPRVDLEVQGSLGKTYFVRIAPDKVVKLSAESDEQALAWANRTTARP